MQNNNERKGAALNLSVTIAREYEQPLLVIIRKMADEMKRELKRVFNESTHHGAMDDADGGGNVAAQARITLNALLEKYEPIFARVGKKTTKRMMSRVAKNSAVTLGMSLRQAADGITLKTDLMPPSVLEIISACTTEATGLIRLIPQKYITEVQGQVMRSIVSGNGLQDLVPFLNDKYGQNIRHARNVAMDQTRKAYSGITAGRLQALGVKKYEWLHIGGSNHPRTDHVEMSGKIYELDNPPIIGTMYGKQVRGKPGDLPNCRCVMKPIIEFLKP